MLNFITSPELFNFSRNPIYCKVSTDNYKDTVNFGLTPTMYFHNLQLAVALNTITISWTASTITYTFDAVTNLAANKLRVWNGVETPYEYAAALAAILITDIRIAPYFNISAYEHSLYFISKTPGTTNNWVTNGHTVPGAGYWAQQGTNDIRIVAKENYKLWMELFVETEANSGVYIKKIVSPKEPNDINQVNLDLQKFIDVNLQYTLPNFGNYIAFSNPFFCPQTCKKFYVKIIERYGEPVADYDDLETAPTLAIKSGFDTISSRLFKNDQLNYYWTNKAFLTRQPRIKKISLLQKEWLYFCFDSTLTGSAKVRYLLYDQYNNEIADYYSLNGATGITAGNVWGFPITADSSPFQSYPTAAKMIVKIWHIDSDVALSEDFTYLLDTKTYLDESFLYFINSDAGLDTLRCFGVREFNIDFSREVSKRTLTEDDSTFDGNNVQLYAEKNNKFTVFSGWKTKSELKYVEEVFLSKLVFTYSNDYTQEFETPVIITSSTLQVNKTNNNLFGYVIEYREAITSEISQARYYEIMPAGGR